MGLSDRDYHKEHIKRIERDSKRRRLLLGQNDGVPWVPALVMIGILAALTVAAKIYLTS